MEYKKGHKKAGGRKPGTPNKATENIKNLLNRLLPEDRLEREWEHHLTHKDPHIRWKAFELANVYLFGKPVQPIQGAEDAPPILINVSAIPKKRERVMEGIAEPNL
jgi:hypothetical protein